MKPLSILVIRRDNIGDLVCTTPLFSVLRQHFPHAHLAALVNSYNAPVLRNNPDLDAVHVYRKAKHRHSGESRLSIWLETLRLIWSLRQQSFDFAIGATPARQASNLKFAKLVNAKQIIAYGEKSDGIDLPLPVSAITGKHEAESVMQLLGPLGIHVPPPPTRVFAGASTHKIPERGQAPLIALHISARKPAQRWPIENFAKLARSLHQQVEARFILLWSPGASDNPLHPGDDDKAKRLMQSCADLPITAVPTRALTELIDALADCDQVICSDGGAMHLAAGLGKPIVCFFGNSDAVRWHPWGVHYELLQPESREVKSISVEEAEQAYHRLVANVRTKERNNSLY